MAFPINPNDNRRTVVPAAAATAVSFDFPVEKQEWLTVKRWNGATQATLTLGVDYTVTGVGQPAGGTINLTTPANGTDIYSLTLDIPIQRLSDYQKRASLKSEALNLDFDRAIQIIQRLDDKIKRAPTRFDTDTSSTELKMPRPPASSSYLQLNPDGSLSLTGSAPTPVFNFLAFNPETYGAIGDGVTDDTVALQAAEDAAAAAASATGKAVTLLLTGTYIVSNSILKKANVIWWGGGAIKHKDYATQPTLTVTTQFALVYANGVNGWTIDGIRFFSIKHSTVVSNALPRKGGDSPNPGNWNSAVDASGCDNWTIRNCDFFGFSQGIKFSDCENFSIHDNALDDESGLTVASMIAGTYTKPYTQSGTFGIGQLYDAGGPSPKSTRFLISSNRIKTPGVDAGIFALSQTYDEQPGIVSNNFIYGAGGPGIMLYRGSFTDPGGAPTYESRTVIIGNIVYGTWEQGFYIRGVGGVLVDGNYLVETGKAGTNGDGSVGGIVTRINPFSTDFAATFASQASLSSKAGVIISNNKIINPGSATQLDGGGITGRVSWCHIHSNDIIRDEKTYTTRVGEGIELSNEQEEGVLIEHNRIFNFATGIGFLSVLGDASEEIAVVSHNHILLVNTGIELNSFRWNGVEINHNHVKDAATRAISIRNSPRSVIEHNYMVDSAIGLELRAGTLASIIPWLMTGGVTPAAVTKSVGSTLVVRKNTYINCTTPHAVAETATGDTTFQGRCLVWEDDIVDGKPIDGNEYAGAAWVSSPRTFHVGDVLRNSTIAAATLYSKVCSVAGSAGSAAIHTFSTTCNTSAGVPTVTTLGSWDGVGPGIYVTIAGTVHYIKTINPAGNSLVVDPAPAATATGATLANTQPTFIDLLTVGAT